MSLTSEFKIGVISSFRVLENGIILTEITYDSITGLVNFSQRLNLTTTTVNDFWKLINDSITWIGMIKSNYTIPINNYSFYKNESTFDTIQHKLEFTINTVTFKFDHIGNDIQIHLRPAVSMNWKDFINLKDAVKQFTEICRNH